jgi:hypothetical protein
MGEQKPFDDQSEIKAKCVDCSKQERDAEIQRVAKDPLPGSKNQRIVEFENGLQGLITIAGKETPDLSFWDVLFENKKFFCCKPSRKEFDAYLAGLPGDQLDITFPHSMEIPIDPPKRGRRKKTAVEETKPAEKRESISYNCTIRVPKKYALHVFETKSEQNTQLIHLIAEIAEKQYRREKESEQAAASKAPVFDVGL